MATTRAEWPPKEQVQVEGIAYDVFICRRGKNRFQVSWTCLECGEKADLQRIGSTPDEAKFLGEIAIGVHHQLLHGVSRRPKPR